MILFQSMKLNAGRVVVGTLGISGHNRTLPAVIKDVGDAEICSSHPLTTELPCKTFFTCKSLRSRKPFVLAKPSIHRMHSRHHCLLIAITKQSTDILKIYSEHTRHHHDSLTMTIMK